MSMRSLYQNSLKTQVIFTKTNDASLLKQTWQLFLSVTVHYSRIFSIRGAFSASPNSIHAHFRHFALPKHDSLDESEDKTRRPNAPLLSVRRREKKIEKNFSRGNRMALVQKPEPTPKILKNQIRSHRRFSESSNDGSSSRQTVFFYPLPRRHSDGGNRVSLMNAVP